MDNHVLEAGLRKLSWTANRNEERVDLTPNQAQSILDRLSKLEDAVSWYQDRDFNSEGPPSLA